MTKNISKDKCSNCGVTSSKTFWDFEDGSVLCDKCCNKIGNDWEARNKNKEDKSKIKKHGEKHYVITIKKIYLYLIGGLIIILLSFFIISSIVSNVTEQDIKSITNTRAVTSYEDVSTKLSFSNYLNDIYTSDKQNATLNGYLKRNIEGNRDTGTQVVSIVDDYGNEIRLEGQYPEFKRILPDIGKTGNLYSIRGTFKRTYKRLEFQVDNISLYQREPNKKIEVNNVETYTEEIITNRTHPKHPSV